MDRIDELWSALNELRERVAKLEDKLRDTKRDLQEELDRKVDKPYER